MLETTSGHTILELNGDTGRAPRPNYHRKPEPNKRKAVNLIGVLYEEINLENILIIPFTNYPSSIGKTVRYIHGDANKTGFYKLYAMAINIVPSK